MKKDKSSWAIGGGVLIGLGAGVVLLPVSALAFLGALFGGIGLGLIVTSITAMKEIA